MFMVLLGSGFRGFSQTWTGGGGDGNWTTPTNWSTNAVPVTGATVIFNTNENVNFDVVASLSIDALQITNNATVAITNPNQVTLTITGTTSQIGAGSTLNLSGAAVLSVTFTGSSRTFDISGILNIGDNVNFNFAFSTTIVSGTFKGTGNTGVIITSTPTNLNFSSSGTFELASNGGVVPTATWDANSTLKITGIQGTNPTGFSQSFGNVIWNCTG